MPFWGYGGFGIKRSEVGLDKNGVKTPACFSEPSAYCCVSYFPYESELSTGSPPHISSGACATQKNKLTINRDKPLVFVSCGHHSVYMATNRIKTVGVCKIVDITRKTDMVTN